MDRVYYAHILIKSKSEATAPYNVSNRQNSAPVILAQKHSDIKLAIIIYQKKLIEQQNMQQIMSELSIMSIEYEQKQDRSKSSTERSQPTKFDTCNFWAKTITQNYQK